MCEPLTLTAMGLAAAGTIMQQMGRQEQQDAVTAAANRGNEQSQRYADEANRLFRDSIDKADRQSYEEAQAKAAERRRAALLPPDLVPMPQKRDGESDATAAAIERAFGGARNDLVQQGEARAALGGGTDAFSDVSRAILPNAEGIGFLRRDIDANDSLTQLQMQGARNAGGGLRTIGSLFSGLGTMAGLGAGAGESFGSLGDKVSNGWNWLTNSGPSAPARGNAIYGFMPG